MEISPYNKSIALDMNGIKDFFNPFICYPQPNIITSNGVYQGENPLNFALPLFILQVMIIVVITQIVIMIFKPLRQPRVVSEIVAGILLGPSGFGAIDWIGKNIFPLKSLMVLDTMAKIGILYYMFLVGVEMDVSLVKQSNRQTLAMVVFGLVLPGTLYFGIQLLAVPTIFNNELFIPPMGLFFIAITISFTAFPVLSRILVELKLFNTEFGRKAMSTALVLDLCGWFLIGICVFWVETTDIPEKRYVLILSAIGFVLVCFLVVRPTIILMIKYTPEGENFSDFSICVILTGVMISGFITDVIGLHPVFGAFVFGLIIPNGLLATTILEKLEDFVTILLLPVFFALSGMRVNVLSTIKPGEGGPFKYLIYFEFVAILLANAAKTLGIFLVGIYFDMQIHEALSLGLLMNSKGVIEAIVLSAVKYSVGNQSLFSTLMICMVAATTIATPATTTLYETSRHFISYKRMTIQKSKLDTVLNIIMCIHTTRNVPAMVNLLEVTHSTKKSHLHVYPLNLVELTGRASSMLIVHNASKSGTKHSTINPTQNQSEYILKAFENYAQQASNVIVQPFTVISPYTTMHEDICNLAEDKHVALIIVPFHKQQTVDGGMESINSYLHQVNQNILANAPCSVGILIDRGLVGSTSHVPPHIVVIFVGGSDDREALAYGWRMAENSGVNLTVVRFILRDDVTKETTKRPCGNETLEMTTDVQIEAQLDDEYIGDFRVKVVGEETIMYKENVVNNAEETVSAILGMVSINDFYIVGIGNGNQSTLLAGLKEFSENPELGAIGDLLASSDFTTSISILVVQQYIGERTPGASNKLYLGESFNQ